MYIQVFVHCDEPSQLESAKVAMEQVAEELRTRDVAGSTSNQVSVQLNASTGFNTGTEIPDAKDL